MPPGATAKHALEVEATGWHMPRGKHASDDAAMRPSHDIGFVEAPRKLAAPLTVLIEGLKFQVLEHQRLPIRGPNIISLGDNILNTGSPLPHISPSGENTSPMPIYPQHSLFATVHIQFSKYHKSNVSLLLCCRCCGSCKNINALPRSAAD
jgi:hypothetical protein